MNIVAEPTMLHNFLAKKSRALTRSSSDTITQNQLSSAVSFTTINKRLLLYFFLCATWRLWDWMFIRMPNRHDSNGNFLSIHHEKFLLFYISRNTKKSEKKVFVWDNLLTTQSRKSAKWIERVRHNTLWTIWDYLSFNYTCFLSTPPHQLPSNFPFSAQQTTMMNEVISIRARSRKTSILLHFSSRSAVISSEVSETVAVNWPVG